MVGSATFTIVTSSRAMNWPASRTVSMIQRPRPAPAAVPGSRRMDSDVVVMIRACGTGPGGGESLLMLVLALPGYARAPGDGRNVSTPRYVAAVPESSPRGREEAHGRSGDSP